VTAVPTFHIDDLDLFIKQKIWQKMVDSVHDHIVSVVNSVLGKKIPNFINRKLSELNAAVDNEGPNTFVTEIIS